MSVCHKTVNEICELLKNREIGAMEVTQDYLHKIKHMNADINCYVTISEKEAIYAAEKAQKLIDSGMEKSPLCGVPIGVKDNICTEGIRTTCGSKMLRDFTPPYSSTVVNKLKNQGSVILGKLNMDEFSMGSQLKGATLGNSFNGARESESESSIFGPVHNPRNKDFVAGGLSEGSAAAICANLAGFALSSDTNGEIRQSASFCGVVGLKPTYGLVSRYGLTACGSSLEQIGPVTKDVKDCALVLNAISGYDPMDSTCISKDAENYLDVIEKGVKGLKIGLPVEFFDTGLDADIKESIFKTVRDLEQLGARSEEITIPIINNSVPCYYLISSAEVSANLARYDGIRFGYRSLNAQNISELYRLSRAEGFSNEVKRRILLGTYALSSDNHDKLYNKALKVRRLITNEFNNAFDKCDCLVAPVYPSTAFKIGKSVKDPLKMYINDIYTVSANLAGLPALVVPCGFGKNGMPIGIQLIGKAFSEKLLLRIGLTIEKRHINSKGGELA